MKDALCSTPMPASSRDGAMSGAHLCFGVALVWDLASARSTRHNPDVGATHSEGAVAVQTASHQKRDVPRAHTDEERVALFRRLQAMGCSRTASPLRAGGPRIVRVPRLAPSGMLYSEGCAPGSKWSPMSVATGAVDRILEDLCVPCSRRESSRASV
jgi:hypothetical protein